MINQIQRSPPHAAELRGVNQTLRPYLLRHLRPLVGADDVAGEAAILAYTEALAPRDATEELLVAQMLATYQSGMTCLQRAAEVDKLALRHLELLYGERLLNLFSRQFEEFEKRRHRLKVDRLVPGVLALPQARRG